MCFVCRMPVVLLLLFQVVAGIALFIFLLHYLSYIFNAIIRDFCETLLTTKEFLQQLQQESLLLYGANANAAAATTTNTAPPTATYNYPQQQLSFPSSETSGGDKRNFSKIPIKVQKMQTSTDDAKFIKK